MDKIGHSTLTEKKINYQYTFNQGGKLKIHHDWNNTFKPFSLFEVNEPAFFFWERYLSKSTCLGLNRLKFTSIGRHSKKSRWNMNYGIRMPILIGFILWWRCGRSQWEGIFINFKRKKGSRPYSVRAHAGIYEKHKYQRQGQMEVL
jgi:hypothetical protein